MAALCETHFDARLAIWTEVQFLPIGTLGDLFMFTLLPTSIKEVPVRDVHKRDTPEIVLG